MVSHLKNFFFNTLFASKSQQTGAPFEGEQGGQLARAGLPLLFHDFWPYNLINFTPRYFPIHLP